MRLTESDSPVDELLFVYGGEEGTQGGRYEGPMADAEGWPHQGFLLVGNQS